MTMAEFLHKIDKELYGHKHILRMVVPLRMNDSSKTNFECDLFPEKPLYALNETNIALFEPFTLGPLACSRSGRCLGRCCWGIDRERYPP